MKAKSCVAAVLMAIATSAVPAADAAAEAYDIVPGASGSPQRGPAPGEGILDFGSMNAFYSALESFALVPYSSAMNFSRSTPSLSFVCQATGTENRAVGQFHLPHGVQMNALRTWAFDNSASDNMTVDLSEQCLPDFGAGAPVNTPLASTTTSGQPGATTEVAFISSVRADNTSCTYRVIVTFGNTAATCTGLNFTKARIEWLRVTPPAPAVATFIDVPTGHQFFGFVEALAAANVTLGCTATSFCVNDPVTRGQMAAFLVRALSLQPRIFPDPANP